MSQPVAGKLSVVAFDGVALRVVDDGDWFTAEGEPVPERVLRVLSEGGAVVYGPAEPMPQRTPLEKRGPGQSDRATLLALRVPVQPGTYVWTVYAGHAYPEPGGGWWEWGYRQNLTGTPNTGTVVVPAGPRPTGDLARARAELVEALSLIHASLAWRMHHARIVRAEMHVAAALADLEHV